MKTNIFFASILLISCKMRSANRAELADTSSFGGESIATLEGTVNIRTDQVDSAYKDGVPIKLLYSVGALEKENVAFPKFIARGFPSVPKDQLKKIKINEYDCVSVPFKATDVPVVSNDTKVGREFMFMGYADWSCDSMNADSEGHHLDYQFGRRMALGNCLDDDFGEKDGENLSHYFYRYFRPNKPTCRYRAPWLNSSPDEVVKFEKEAQNELDELSINRIVGRIERRSDQFYDQETAKPDYRKIWQDKVLRIVFVFGTANSVDKDEELDKDSFITSAKDMFATLKQWGEKRGYTVNQFKSSVESSGEIFKDQIAGTTLDIVGANRRLTFEAIGIKQGSEVGDQKAFCEKFMVTPDLIMLFRHSNQTTRAEDSLIECSKLYDQQKNEEVLNHYRLIVNNGCARYGASPVSDLIRQKMYPFTYSDILLNRNLAYCGKWANEFTSLIESLWDFEKKTTYKEILQKLDPAQFMIAVSSERS